MSSAFVVKSDTSVLVTRSSVTLACIEAQLFSGEPKVIHNATDKQRVILAGQRGRQGEPGPAGGSVIQLLCGETISALRAVYEQDGFLYALDNTDALHVDQLVGVSLTSGSTSELINVQLVGIVEDSNWSWNLGRVYLGALGALTQNPPASGFLVLLGYAVSPTRLVLNIQDNIEL